MALINILVPIAGHAQRFIDAGFASPKPLIMVRDKHMIDWALSCIKTDNCRLIFVVRKDHVMNFSIDKILKDKFQNCQVIIIDEVTQGTLCTCLMAQECINNADPLVIYTPDVYFEPQFDPYSVLGHLDGLLLTFKANSPAHSYAKTNDVGHVVATAEKQVISEQAAVGVYYFSRGSDFVALSQISIDNKITTNGEYYVCPVYNYLIKGGGKVGLREVNKMHVLGTPRDLQFFTNRTLKRFGDKPIALCADHSGHRTKELYKEDLNTLGIRYIDFGTYVEQDCDHHDFLSQAIKHIQNGTCDFGMGFCRTGQGFNIAANKAVGIRSALISDIYTAEMSVRHNAANFFAVPSTIDALGSEILVTLRDATFDGGRHMTRIQKIEDGKLFHE